MIQKTRMAIDAYLRQAGIGIDTTERQKKFIPLKQNAEIRFGDILTDLASNLSENSAADKNGATIADYFRRGVPSAGLAGFNYSTRSDALSHSLSEHHPTMAYASVQKSTDRQTIPDTPTQKRTTARNSDDMIHNCIRAAAERYDLSVELIGSIIRTESNFQPDAISPAGAQGLMQLMPATARELGVTDPFNIEQNIDGGCRYMRQMLDRFGGDVKLALAAYNAGPGTVMRYDGNVPYRETQDYVQRVLSGMASEDQAPA
jgi:soluble lytic murein transglycosylase-like protein